MDGPTYPAAKSYTAPERLPSVLNSTETPLETLRSIPAAWEIVTSEIPGMERRISSEQIQPHLANFSLQSLTVFGIVNSAIFPVIDERLQELGEYP